MMKWKTKKNGYQLMVTVKLPFREKVEEQQLSLFVRKSIKGLFKVHNYQKRKVEYIGPIGISMADRLKKPVSKYEFFLLLEQVIDVLQRVNAGGLNVFHLILDTEHVYVNEVTKELQFIYLPVVGQMPRTDILGFLESIIYSARPLHENDIEYISRLVFFMNGLQGFEPDKIESFIAKEDSRIVQAIKHNRPVNSGFLTDKPMDYYEHYDHAQEEEETGLLMGEEETGLLVFEEETGLLPDNGAMKYATLFRVMTEELIGINKTVFRIGKEGGYSDYTVSGNDKISRSHADIITRGNRYYVMDLNSRNRTFINDRVIPIQEETELFDGDILKLANEEFVFHV